MWSDILTVIRVVLFTTLSLGIVYAAKTNDALKERCRKLTAERDAATRENERYEASMQKRRESDAYNKGLYDARKTDELYRQLLAKHTRGEHTTLIMYGETPEGKEGKAQ